jgi:DNA-binding NarL/FixJ family response regulator
MKILIVDDHGLFRSGVALMLNRMDIPDTSIFGAETAEQGLELLKTGHDWRIVLLDLNLPDLSGEALVRIYRAAHLTVSLILLSGTEDLALARRCIGLGAQGFIHKSTDSQVFATALRKIRAGESIWLAGQAKTAAILATPPLLPSIDTQPIKLTERQLEVLRWLCRGWSNKEIARHLNISENTVKNHIAAILLILGGKNRSEAIIISQKLGLVA